MACLSFPVASLTFDVIDLLFFPLLQVGIFEPCWLLSLIGGDLLGGEFFLNTKGDKDLGDDPTEPPVDLRDSLDIRLSVDFSIEAVPLVLSTSLESFVPFVSRQELSPFWVSCRCTAWSNVDIVVHEADIPSGYGGDVPLTLTDVSLLPESRL